MQSYRSQQNQGLFWWGWADEKELEHLLLCTCRSRPGVLVPSTEKEWMALWLLLMPHASCFLNCNLFIPHKIRSNIATNGYIETQIWSPSITKLKKKIYKKEVISEFIKRKKRNGRRQRCKCLINGVKHLLDFPPPLMWRNNSQVNFLVWGRCGKGKKEILEKGSTTEPIKFGAFFFLFLLLLLCSSKLASYIFLLWYPLAYCAKFY